MKICAIICEFNPFHNGHKYLIDSVRRSGKFDGVLCLMSGPFTQRGDRAIADKFTRARHAVLGGADCTAELPASFAVAPAQVFAEGAIKILSSVPDVCALAFGCEETLDFKAIASGIAAEDGAFKEKLAASLKSGESYAKSYFSAVKEATGASIGSPNNILATEYAKAALKYRPELLLMPVKRLGSAYNERQLGGIYASASAIREHLGEEEIKKFVPPFAANDLAPDCAADERWKAIQRYALASSDAQKISRVYGGGEGLANRLKSLSDRPVEDIIYEATTKRYPSSRIRRVLAANALGLTEKDGNAFLGEGGFIKPLAVKCDRADDMLNALAKSDMPVVITGNDVRALKGNSARMYEKNSFAHRVWCLTAGRDVYDCTLLKV